jgi:hypothetical protein
MRYHLPETLAFSTICGCLLLFLLFVESYARIVPPRDPREGVLDASLVLIVRPETQDWFRIEEVFLGDQRVGDAISLPGFKLYTIQESGPELVEPMTPNTRVLLFLKNKEDGWEVTDYGYCFFWRHEPEKAPELRAIAEKTVSLRKSWEAARDTDDEQLRVEALWPYLWGHGVSFLKHTEKELQKIGPVAGDYIARKFESMTYRQRTTLMRDLGVYGSELSHQALIECLKSRQRLYESFLAERGATAEGLIEDWNHTPEAIKDIYGELYSGLAGLGSFKDRNDLPFVRELALWAVGHRFKQTCDAALNAFRDMPDEANLPVIDAIWREFSARQKTGDNMSSIDVVRTLKTHVYPAAVPLLVSFLKDAHAGSEARGALAQIVEQNLGPNPDDWLNWYRVHMAERLTPDEAQETRRPPNGVPIIRLDKSRFALGESIFFWVGVKAISRGPIPKEYQNTCRLIITRPDGASKTEPVGWPKDGPEDSGWLGGWGWGSNETQPGRYALAFEFAGQRTELVSLLVEGLPILKQIEAEFVFSRSGEGLAIPDGNVTLIVRNNSDQTLRFLQPGGFNSMVSVSLSKSDRSYRNDFFYPVESLPAGGNSPAITFGAFTWDVASRAPSVTIRPGETYRQEMPLRAALAEAAEGLSVHPGRYDVTFSTALQILIGEKGGKWSEISPVRVPVSATAACVIAR